MQYEQKNGIYMRRHDIVIPRGMVLVSLYDIYTHKLVQDIIKNTFVTAGKNSLAKSLRGLTTNNQGIITYCALGTGITAPELTDVKLEAEIFRKLVSVRSDDGGNIANFQTFFSTAEANGSLREAGLFGDAATAVADSGTLFCHLAINREKTTSNTLTLDWDVEIGS